jgi:hypothetical protein
LFSQGTLSPTKTPQKKTVAATQSPPSTMTKSRTPEPLDAAPEGAVLAYLFGQAQQKLYGVLLAAPPAIPQLLQERLLARLHSNSSALACIEPLLGPRMSSSVRKRPSALRNPPPLDS